MEMKYDSVTEIKKENHFGDNKNNPREKIKMGRKSLPDTGQPKPDKSGVILLGRGNSFSLGRSEVILLHHRPKQRSVKRNSTRGSSKEESQNVQNLESGGIDAGHSIQLQPIHESSDGLVRLNLSSKESDGAEFVCQSVPSFSPPPPISNGLLCLRRDSQEDVVNGKCVHLDDNDDNDVDNDDVDDDESSASSRVLDLIPCYEDDLKDLWKKAESVMSQRNVQVKKILEDYGIGEPGGGGGGEEEDDDWEYEGVEDRKKEEEEVWQIIQDSFRV